MESDLSAELFNNCSDSSMITELSLIYNIANELNNHQCTETSLLFFCNVTYTLCGDDHSLSLREECVQVRDDTCVAEWRIVDNLLNNSTLNCTLFENENDSILPIAPTLMCPDNFEIVCNSFCLPSCNYNPTGNNNDNVFRVWLSSFSIFALIGGMITLIMCFVKREKMSVVVYG